MSLQKPTQGVIEVTVFIRNQMKTLLGAACDGIGVVETLTRPRQVRLTDVSWFEAGWLSLATPPLIWIQRGGPDQWDRNGS